ncbi:hypothetical protein CCR75_004546 [Bremia lactucae]|uniref:Cytochrome c oxidase assembly protein COX20, mitochondrial n=1 Tax=Bremia lactucae TaxID=4779 RepID=A0A976FIP5_BRELC|nr:hypothetical protein CCR75_004546 [Bremia lactucae]
MWGIGVASVIGAHRFRTTSKIRSSCDWAIGAFGLVSSSSWLFCTTSYRLRTRQTREFMEVMNNPDRKAEAEQFLRSRVQPRSSDQDQNQ